MNFMTYKAVICSIASTNTVVIGGNLQTAGRLTKFTVLYSNKKCWHSPRPPRQSGVRGFKTLRVHAAVALLYTFTFVAKHSKRNI
jgi:hypothetical protein